MNILEPRFKLLSPYLVKHHWSDIVVMLEKADDLSMRITDLQDVILRDPLSFDIWVYLDSNNKISYTCLCYELGQTYFIARVAKSDTSTVSYDVWPEIVDGFRERASYLGKNSLRFSGSKAWSKKLKGTGFSIKEYLYELPINN